MAVVNLSLFALFSVLLSACSSSTRPSALPPSATEVQEHHSASGSDYVMCVRAKLPESDLAVYANNLHLSERFDPVKHATLDLESVLNMGADGMPSWWTPPLASSTTYYSYTDGREALQVLKYSNGYAYYLSMSW